MRRKELITVELLCKELSNLLRIDVSVDAQMLPDLSALLEYCNKCGPDDVTTRQKRYIALSNWKFRLNADAQAAFFFKSAKLEVRFNFHEKKLIGHAFDSNDRDELATMLDSRSLSESIKRDLLKTFTPVCAEYTVAYINKELIDPSKLRKEKGDRDIAREIINAQIAAYAWSISNERVLHGFFDPQGRENYSESYWGLLQQRNPSLFNRNRALEICILDSNSINVMGGEIALTQSVVLFLTQAYQKLNNYGFCSLVIRAGSEDGLGPSIAWRLCEFAKLFAEKHIEKPLDKMYFRHERIKETTLSYIPSLDQNLARFELVNEGFTYRDTFIHEGHNGEIQQLTVIFQKNERDETLIPCPACRSGNVQGNSYPSLGVRSWECDNSLCPDRSKYNRGKRYSFKSIVMQQAIEDDKGAISEDLVRQWNKDVVRNAGLPETIEMLVKFFSFHGDTVYIYGSKNAPKELFGRTMIRLDLSRASSDGVEAFRNQALFRRYAVDDSLAKRNKSPSPFKNIGAGKLEVYNGDSARVLSEFQSDHFDGAVTSPPYYNAREYSQWPNIYCHLEDIFKVNRQVYRTLKPGGLYLYNIFDYFDNENSVALSAMGNKRLVLASYTVDLFRRIGFVLDGCIVWDKGDIEGKRGFNAGNYSPYYQAPFNCWEHILVFRKPGSASNNASAIRSFVLKERPVFKMVRGVNIHGHTAPFPSAIPMILVNALPVSAKILDPYGGSLTTGRVAASHGRTGICIEQSEEYCRLGLKLHRELKDNQGAQQYVFQ